MKVDPTKIYWRIVNDEVMGGCSTSAVQQRSGDLRFRGELSTANGGGFASVLGKLDSYPEEMLAVRLAVSGDGREYQLRLRDNDAPDRVAWRDFFSTRQDPASVTIHLADLQPVIRGVPAIGATPLEQNAIRYLGFTLASRQPGSFFLTVHEIEILSGKDLHV